MGYTIDINCDVGEGIANEAELMPYLSSCSIACGAHAGNSDTIRKTIEIALKHNVKIGAHPSFPDRKNFGRILVELPPKELQKSIENQINKVQLQLNKQGGTLNHIKMHGALYNLSARDSKTAKIIIRALQKVSKGVFLYVPYNSVLQKLAIENNIKIKIEAFADRNYNSDLTLVSRKNKNGILTNPKKAAQHLLKMILEKRVISIDGVVMKIEAETFCIHGDNLNAKNLLKTIHKTLVKNKIKIV